MLRNSVSSDQLRELIKSPYDVSAALMLVRQGADPDLVDYAGGSLIHQLVMADVSKYSDYIRELINKHGAKIDFVNVDGLTPLQVCMNLAQFSASSAMLLVQLGAKIDVFDKNGYSLLYHLSCEKVSFRKDLNKDIEWLLDNRSQSVLNLLQIHYSTPVDPSELKSNRSLGRGACANAFLSTLVDKNVVVKSFRFKMGLGAAFSSFYREMHAMNQIKSPYVISFIGYCINLTTGPCALSLVMEYAENGSLDNMITSYPKPEQERRNSLVEGVVEGVCAIHGANIVHGDLKPGNVLLTGQFQVKISDYDLSRRVAPNTDSLGSPMYVAPEVIRGYGISTCSDVYSMSLLMLEIDSWTPAERLYPSYIDTIEKVCSFTATGHRPTTPSQTTPKVAHLVKLGFLQNPNDRPTAKMIRDELQSGIDKASSQVSVAAVTPNN